MGKSKGGMAPDNTCEEEEHILKDMDRLIKEFHDPARFAATQCSSLFTLSFTTCAASIYMSAEATVTALVVWLAQWAMCQCYTQLDKVCSHMELNACLLVIVGIISDMSTSNAS